MAEDWRAALGAALERRFGEAPAVPDDLRGGEQIARMAAHRSMRHFTDRGVEPDLLRLLCAVALSAPTKSDLQQADIVIVEDKAARARIQTLIGEANDWAAKAPAFLVFCGDNRRQRQLHAWRGHAFANDHLDAFFNAAVDAGIVLATFVAAAEAAGLGVCPVSAIRNRAAEASELLGLPDHVFPVAGLGVGWPSFEGVLSPRLPLDATVHVDRHSEDGLRARVDAYDRRRHALQPYRRPRDPARFGEAAFYGWSEDKARQYAVPEREGFGAFVRAKGFRLD